MNMGLRIIIVSILSMLLMSCSTSGFKSVENFDLRPFKEAQLSNGLKVILVEDNSLPYFTLQMMVRSGASSDPTSKAGLAYLVGNMLEKGTRKRDALKIADDLGFLGADFGVSVSKDYTMVHASSLSTYKPELIDNFVEIVTSPSFKNSEIARLKREISSRLQKTVDDPSGFAGVMFESYLYGSHPYARRSMGTKRSIRSIKKKDIIKSYLSKFRPNNSMLAVVGKFDKKKIIPMLEEKFKTWKPRKPSKLDYPEFPQISGVQIRLIDKNDLKQTQIRMGHKGIKRDNPDFLSLRLANIILGGAFASRLVDEIREKRGLTYSINSNFGARQDYGPFLVSTFTRHEKVGETVKQTLNVLDQFRKSGATDQEVNDARALMLGIFPRALETAEKLASNLLILRYYNIPDSYLRDYVKNVNKLTTKDVNEAIVKYLDPDNIKVLVYSSSQKVISQLRPLGIVQVKNYKEFIQ